MGIADLPAEGLSLFEKMPDIVINIYGNTPPVTKDLIQDIHKTFYF
jgi:hypothetical protein